MDGDRLQAIRVPVPDEALRDPRARLRATRRPAAAPGCPWEQGTDLDHLRALTGHWADRFACVPEGALQRAWYERLNRSTRFAQWRVAPAAATSPPWSTPTRRLPASATTSPDGTGPKARRAFSRGPPRPRGRHAGRHRHQRLDGAPRRPGRGPLTATPTARRCRDADREPQVPAGPRRSAAVSAPRGAAPVTWERASALSRTCIDAPSGPVVPSPQLQRCKESGPRTREDSPWNGDGGTGRDRPD
ncbi:epoxide hydrolase N-terminal domain-containing protein [Streptomyces sp. CA2R106]|uniref:epoxide hydrolase N-terminal domain-containing protein n=1 Tax=Streptomyces sp. CA2R106 TaxID=3120153 RepID=UPI003FA7CFDC